MASKFPEEDRSHHLLILKETPPSLAELRRLLQLPEHADITSEASGAATFEEAIGTIAARLDIALDGDYEPEPLFAMLCEALRNRGQFKSQPHLRAQGLVNAEIIERDGTMTLERKEDDGAYIEHAESVSGDSLVGQGNDPNANS